jgi:creatinine amidohydrolase
MTDMLLAVPVGSTEQHGPHLPLSTDTDIAEALALALARRRRDVVVAPTLAYGSSGEHAGFAGTLSVGQEAIELFLVELGRSASNTFRRSLWISTHGGNHEPLLRAQRRLQDEARDVRAFFPSWPGDAHAGRVETSLALALNPGRVRLGRAQAGSTEPLARLMPRMRSSGLRAVSRNGVIGDPSGSSGDEGRVLLDEACEQLVSFVERWLDGE